MAELERSDILSARIVPMNVQELIAMTLRYAERALRSNGLTRVTERSTLLTKSSRENRRACRFAHH